MHEHGALTPQFVGELTDRFQEGRALDVADGAADLAQHEILVGDVRLDEFLDGVGNVRNDLDGSAEIIAAALAGYDVGIDAARGDVVRPARGDAGEALIMAEIEIGLGAVIGDEHLAVLIRAHRARIDIEIGVQLPQTDLETPGLEDGAESRRSQPLAQRRHDAARDEDETRHGPSPYLINNIRPSPGGGPGGKNFNESEKLSG